MNKSYPIDHDISDLLRQIMMLSVHDRRIVRKRIIERAHEIHAEYLIPPNWNEDGTLK